MRHACPACRASAPWPGRSWSWCTCSGAPGTWERISPGWMYRLGIEIGRKDDTMCEQCKVTPAVMGRAARRKAQREHDARVAADAIRSYQNGVPQPRAGAFDRATGKAKTALAWTGGICAAAAVGSGALGAAVHILAWVLGILAGLVVLAVAGVVTWRVQKLSRRPLPYPAPAPDRVLNQRPLTRVDSVTVLPLERAAGRPAIVKERSRRPSGK